VLGQGLRVQRAEPDRGHAGQPLQLGGERPERMPPVQVVGAVGADQRDPFGTQDPGQERQQVPR
jgi:hypothetical protein